VIKARAMRGANVSPTQRGKTWVADETDKAASFHLRPDHFKFFKLFQDSSTRFAATIYLSGTFPEPAIHTAFGIYAAIAPRTLDRP